MIKLSLEGSIYKLKHNRSYHVLDICYHYFEPIFSVFNFLTNYVGFTFHKPVRYLDITKSQISNPAVLCGLSPKI